MFCTVILKSSWNNSCWKIELCIIFFKIKNKIKSLSWENWIYRVEIERLINKSEFCFFSSIDDRVDQGTVLPTPDVPEQGRRDRGHGNDLWTLALRGVNIRAPVAVWGRFHSGEPLRCKCLWPALCIWLSTCTFLYSWKEMFLFLSDWKTIIQRIIELFFQLDIKHL